MKNNQEIRRQLYKFLKCIMYSSQPKKEDLFLSHLSKRVPESIINSEPNEFGYTSLSLYGDEYHKYKHSLSLLSNIIELEYLSSKELEALLWELVCEVYFNKEIYYNKKTIDSKINEFLSGIEKPIVEYEIIIGVDHLTTQWSNYDFWGCQIACFDQEAYDAIFQANKKTKLLETTINRLMNKTFIKLLESGNNKSLIVSRAKENATLKLNALRTLINFKYLNINEKQILFEISDTSLILEKETQKIVHLNWFNKEKYWKYDWKEQLPEHIEDYTHLIDKIENFSQDLQSRLNRVISWLGRAIQEESYDFKIIYLCAALETLLVYEKSGLKGERISCRLMLFGLRDNKFLDPCKILYIYEIRSIIIHGSEIGIATRSHCGTLMLAINLLLKQFIEFVDENNPKNLKETISLIETDDNINHIKEFLNKVNTKYSEEILNTIDK